MTLRRQHALPMPDVTAAAAPRPDLARRIAKRRPSYFAQAASYFLDAIVLASYAYLGSTTFATAVVYLTFGLATVAIWLVLSETGFNDRFKDHYFTVPQAITSMTIQLGAIYLAPEVGIYFLILLFVVLGFGALRLTARQASYVWTFAAVGLGALLLVVGLDINLPTQNPAERVVALICVVTALARVASTGLYGAGLREALYKRTRELEAARARIEELAYLDELTGASNRRDILRVLDEQVARVGRKQGECAIAIIDLDHFKRINDRFGHAAGDEVLRTFAIMAFATIRRTDKIGRYGGEEFLMVMPDFSYTEAIRAVDRLRIIFADADWSSIASDMRVTMSGGVTCLSESDTTEAALLRADSALYQAKDQGRNRTLLA